MFNSRRAEATPRERDSFENSLVQFTAVARVHGKCEKKGFLIVVTWPFRIRQQFSVVKSSDLQKLSPLFVTCQTRLCDGTYCGIGLALRFFYVIERSLKFVVLSSQTIASTINLQDTFVELLPTVCSVLAASVGSFEQIFLSRMKPRTLGIG